MKNQIPRIIFAREINYIGKLWQDGGLKNPFFNLPTVPLSLEKTKNRLLLAKYERSLEVQNAIGFVV